MPSNSSSSHQPKNIVICCDGTGNEFGPDNSNVVKLYTALIIDNQQVGYYHPGVGTMGAPTARGPIEKQWTRIKGLAFGAGFRDNVLDAYRYLMENYNDGDRVYMFGFSRGAYTVRALSGLLHSHGLLCRGNEGHLPYAWRSFTEMVSHIHDKDSDSADRRHTVVPDFAFQQTFSHENFEIHFVGLWDTVSSVGWIYTPLRLLYTAKNPIIRTARHAVSIDERRCFFRDNLYGDPFPDQDILQVWFAGVHSDVGGSYPQPESALSNITLQWLLNEATQAGVRVDDDRVNLIFGRPTKRTYAAAPLYEEPLPYWPIHKSLHGTWWIVEFLPHRYYDKQENRQRWRIPLGVHRHVPPNSIVHPSVVDRMNHHPYRPPNLRESDLTPLRVKPSGTKANLDGYFFYKAGQTSGIGSTVLKTAAGTVAAAALLGAVFAAKKLL